MLKFFRVPFALSGDRAAVPDAADPGGTVSYMQGYGVDYEEPPSVPTSKNIERDKMNQLYFDATTAISELQAQGIPDFISVALNGGSAYSYQRNAVVRFLNELYVSLVDANTSDPGDITRWTRLTGGLTIIRGDGVTDVSSRIDAANTAGVPVLFIGVAHIATPKTLRVAIVPTAEQIFTTTSQITIDNTQPVRPQWFGKAPGKQGKWFRAAQALPAAGGVVYCSNGRYEDAGMAYDNGIYMNRDNVAFVGESFGQLSQNCRTISNGVVFEGTVLVFANNVSFVNVWVDVGADFIGGGAAREGFTATYGTVAQRNAGEVRRGLRLHNVGGLAKGPTDLVHAMIAAEGYIGMQHSGELTGCYGTHGIVFKAKQIYGSATLNAYMNASDGVIVKSDTHTSDVSVEVVLGDINSFQSGPLGSTPYTVPPAGISIGVFVHAFGATVSKVQMGKINERGHYRGVAGQMDGAFLIDAWQTGPIITDGNTIGLDIQALIVNSSYQRCQFGNVQTRNCVTGAIFQWVTASDVGVGDFHAVNCTDAAVGVGGIANPRIGVVTPENCAFIYQFSGTARPSIQDTIPQGTSSFANMYNTAGGGTAPALSGTWALVGGGNAFRLIPRGGGFEIQGTVSSGANNLVAMVPAWARPAAARQQAVSCYATGSQTQQTLCIDVNGEVRLNRETSLITPAALWLWMGNLYR